MSGWLFYKLGARGFLHWGFNYWQRVGSEEPLDPFFHGDSGEWPGIPFGDPFVIYPGPDGPIDSIRWEVFAESLQDFAILIFLFGIAGARIVYMIQYADQFRGQNKLTAFFQIWNGGIVFYGSVFGGLIGYGLFYYFVMRRFRVSGWKLADAVAPV